MLPPLQIFGDLHPRPPGPTRVQATISILNISLTQQESMINIIDRQ